MGEIIAPRVPYYPEPEPFRYRRGYHRPRPALPAPVLFTLAGTGSKPTAKTCG